MKKVIVLSLATLSISVAHAGLGLGNIASGLTQNITGSSATTTNVNGFFKEAHSTNNLFQQSRAALASAISTGAQSDEIQAKLKSLKTMTDLNEKEVKLQEISKLSEEVLSAAKNDENKTVEQLKTISGQKKQYLLGAAKNYGIAALMAQDLAQGSKQVSMSVLKNPESLTSTGLSLKSAQSLISDVTGIAKHSSMALVELPQLFKKAGINFEAPTSANTKPAEVKDL